jgi:hypothetical protein
MQEEDEGGAALIAIVIAIIALIAICAVGEMMHG